MKFKDRYFPENPPDEAQLKSGRKLMLGENALAAMIFTLGTGQFITGFLLWQGASPSFIALVLALPQLGCVMQLVSPFLFERLKHRKLCIVLVCLGFRLSLALTVLIPFIFGVGGAGPYATFALYFVAFLLAGFVTPGLNQWMLGIAPEAGRGRFFAIRDIISAVATSGIVLAMGTQLDYFITGGQPLIGFTIVFATVFVLTIINILILGRIPEAPVAPSPKISLKDILVPFRDRKFRPVIIFLSVQFAASGLVMSYLPIYLQSGLMLRHNFISVMMLIASAVGMVGSWLWGRLADRSGWKTVVLCGCGVSGIACLGWFFTTPGVALWLAPVFQCLTATGQVSSGTAGLNLQYFASPETGKSLYFGVTATVCNLTGYLSILTAGLILPHIETGFGSHPIALFFAASAVIFVVCIIYGMRKLPK